MVRIILDNGGGQLKYGLAGKANPVAVPNCIAKIDKNMQVFVADEIDTVANATNLSISRPFDRGYIINWNCEIDIWQRVFGSAHMNIDPQDCSLVLTEAPFSPEILQNDCNEVIFEDFNFQSYLRRPASWFSAYNFIQTTAPKLPCCMVVDSGFSFSHIMPIIQQHSVKKAIKRVNVGGKLLTNYLKEMISYRQWNMMEDFLLIDQVKEGLCYVSPNITQQLRKRARSHHHPLHRSPYHETETTDIYSSSSSSSSSTHYYRSGVFVLPDYQKLHKGFVLRENHHSINKEGGGRSSTSGSTGGTNSKEEYISNDILTAVKNNDLQTLTLNSERVAVPEVLFYPGDSNIGLSQCGIAEAVWQSIQELDQVDSGLVLSNILLTGGNVKFSGFKERFENEIRPLLPDCYNFQVHLPSDPELYSWKGASLFGTTVECDRAMVTRKEYLEYGHSYCNKRMEEW